MLLNQAHYALNFDLLLTVSISLSLLLIIIIIPLTYHIIYFLNIFCYLYNASFLTSGIFCCHYSCKIWVFYLKTFFFFFSFCWTGKNPALDFKNQGAVTKLQRMRKRKERTDVHRQRSSYSDTIRLLQQLLSLLCSWNLPKNGKLSKEKFFFSK